MIKYAGKEGNYMLYSSPETPLEYNNAGTIIKLVRSGAAYT
jgi:hypothetical protein